MRCSRGRCRSRCLWSSSRKTRRSLCSCNKVSPPLPSPPPTNTPQFPPPLPQQHTPPHNNFGWRESKKQNNRRIRETNKQSKHTHKRRFATTQSNSWNYNAHTPNAHSTHLTQPPFIPTFTQKPNSSSHSNHSHSNHSHRHRHMQPHPGRGYACQQPKFKW